MYSFDARTSIDGVPSDLQIVYVSHEECDANLDSSRLAELIDECNLRLARSRLLFTCPAGIENEIENAYPEGRNKFKRRLF